MTTQIEPVSPLALDIRLLFSQLTTMQRDWQDEIGFGEEGHRLWHAHTMAPTFDASIDASAALRNYYIAKLALIGTEVAEAIEEIRDNHEIHETYYPTKGQPDSPFEKGEAFGPFKPEGVPSELADIVIRCLSLAGETGIDLGSAIIEKLNYNATRAQRHGGKAI